MATRLTIHLKNVQKINVNGKSKLFNTLSFRLKKNTESEINEKMRSAGDVSKYYTSNTR